MKLLPNSLLGRTALMIALLIILSQVAWFGIVRLFFLENSRNNHAYPLTRDIILAQAALNTLPADRVPSFLAQASTQYGLRIVKDSTAHPVLRRLDNTPFKDLEARLRKTFGPGILVRTEPSSDNLWIRFPVGGQLYWLAIPHNRLWKAFPVDLLLWVAIGLLIAIVGAYLIIFRLNRQLDAVLQAARTIGSGRIPQVLKEAGPQEIRDLSRGINQMVEDLKKLDAERRLMLAGISHDLRTPLTRLRIGIELAGKNIAPALSIGMVRDVEDMDAILTQFLDYARDGSEESPELADFNQIVFDVCQRYTDTGAAVRQETGILPLLRCRKLAVRRLVTNLVDNAVRYGGKDVEVHTEPTGHGVRLTVADRGPGIQSVEPQSLLQPFARENASRSEQRGAGLGLTIAERIVRVHGGELTIHNREGGGLLVCVEIPND